MHDDGYLTASICLIKGAQKAKRFFLCLTYKFLYCIIKEYKFSDPANTLKEKKKDLKKPPAWLESKGSVSENSSEIKGQNQTLKSVIPIKPIPSGPKQLKEKKRKRKNRHGWSPI